MSLNDSSIKKADNKALASLNPSASASTKNDSAKSREILSKDEFLMMLVNQLDTAGKSEMDRGDQFPVNLTQVSQLERLVSSSKSSPSQNMNAGGAVSLAAYLGNEVSYKVDSLQVKNHDAGSLDFSLASDASSVQIDFLTQDGQSKESLELGPVAAGTHSASLDGLKMEGGEYALRITANLANGQRIEVQGRSSGLVTGFVPGADPALLVGNREIKPADIL